MAVNNMPVVHECGFTGCHKVIPFRFRYCKQHASIMSQEYRHDKQSTDSKLSKSSRNHYYNQFKRDKEANQFYHSKAWTQTRDYVKVRDMMISGASGRMLTDHNYIVDHIIPRRLCDNPLDDRNLWLLSRQEHNTKTKLEETMTDQQLKSMTKTKWKQLIKGDDVDG